MIAIVILGTLVFICFVFVVRNFIKTRNNVNMNKARLENNIRTQRNGNKLAPVKEDRSSDDTTFQLNAFPAKMTASLEKGNLRDLRNCNTKKTNINIMNEPIEISQHSLPPKLLNKTFMHYHP